MMRCPVGTPFWDRVDRSGGEDACWPWRYACFTNGYGAYRGDAGKNCRAHRVAYEMANGPIPDGMLVCHRCDNPPCCNPQHLFLGTPADNMADKVTKGRLVASPGESNGTAKITAEVVADIRSRYVKRSPIVSQLAAEYGLNKKHVWAIATGRAWANA